MCDKAFKINRMRAIIAMTMPIPIPLRIRPPKACLPYRRATNACQMPKMLSNGATIARTIPFSKLLGKQPNPQEEKQQAQGTEKEG